MYILLVYKTNCLLSDCKDYLKKYSNRQYSYSIQETDFKGAPHEFLHIMCMYVSIKVRYLCACICMCVVRLIYVNCMHFSMGGWQGIAGAQAPPQLPPALPQPPGMVAYPVQQFQVSQ